MNQIEKHLLNPTKWNFFFLHCCIEILQQNYFTDNKVTCYRSQSY